MRLEGMFVLRKLGTILLVSGISALLSSCLVEQKDEEKISRTTDTLRIYEAGDFIEYDVTAVISTGISDPITKFGILRVQWENPTSALLDPITPTTSYTVLKESTTLTYDGSTEPDAIAERYINQIPANPNQGSIVLYAIDDAVDVDYWLYPDGSTPPDSDIITPVIFTSPIIVGDSLTQSFSVMECDSVSNQCDNEIYNFRDNSSVDGDSAEIRTARGVFTNPFEISFSGGTLLGTGSSLALEFLGDIRDACGTSADRITHNGSMFIMPRVGMIKMSNQCTNISSGDIVFYTVSLRDTSFDF